MIVSPNALKPNVYTRPIVQLRINGIFVPAWSGYVEKSAYSVADTASFDTFCANAPMDYGEVSQVVSPCPYEVFVGQAGSISPKNNTQRLLYGLLEEAETTYEEDRVELRARGVLALLIDQNLTALLPMSETVDKVIAWIISQYGLVPQVASTISTQAPNGVPVGHLLQDAYVSMSRNYKAFEMITALADGLGWDVRVQGTTVIVGPPAKRGTVSELTKVWGASAGERLQVTHNALHARNIKVIVKSYLPRTKSRTASLGLNQNDPAAILALPSVQLPTSPRQLGPSGIQHGASTVGGTYTGEVYTFHIPGLTAAQCDAKAGAIRDDLTRREFIVDYTFSPTMDEAKMMIAAGTEFTLNLSGCSQTSHNGLYHPKVVRWNWDSGEDDSGDPIGLTVQITAYNHEISSAEAPTGGI